MPAEWLADGGFASDANIEDAHSRGITVYAPVRHPRDSSRDPIWRCPMTAKRWSNGASVWALKQPRKFTEQRAATAECVNAIARAREPQFLVRGLNKAKAVALWYALAHNLMRTVALVQRRRKTLSRVRAEAKRHSEHALKPRAPVLGRMRLRRRP